MIAVDGADPECLLECCSGAALRTTARGFS